MKINKIEIASFGKFKNYTLDFSDGFNLIFGKNEDGKSTVMAFISLMLYGTAGTSSRTDISGNIRKKYAPWSGEKMSGDMEIECGGKSYLIHKEFRATAKTDKVTVTDTQTGDALSLPPDTEIGKYFLGIDYTAFEKSIFGGSAESFSGTESGDISTRLSNLTESGDEAVSPKTVVARIDAAMDELVKKRSKGKIALAQDRIDELTAYIENVNNQQEKRRILNAEYEELEKQLSVLSEKAKQNRIALMNEEKRRKTAAYKNLAELYRKAELANDELSAKVKDGNAEEILAECEMRKNSVLLAKDVLLKTEKSNMENLVSEDDMKLYFTLSEEKRSADEAWQKNAQRKKKFLALAVSGAVITALGIIGGIIEPLAFLAVLLGVALILPYLLKLKKGQNPDEISAEKKLKALLESRGCSNSGEFEKAYRESIAAVEKNKLFEKAQADLRLAEESLVEFISGFEAVKNSDDAITFINTLKELKAKAESAWQTASSYASTYEIDETNAEKLQNLAQDIEAELPEKTGDKADADEIDREIKEKNQQLLEIKGQLGTEPEDIGAAIKELEETKKLLGEMQGYYNDLSLAKEVLLEAEDEMRRSFAPALKDRASEILSHLTNGKYKSLSTDKTYEIEVKSDDTAGYRKWHYLSRGTCAQSYLALRLAVCEMLSDNEPVPLFLDDVLADYDDERAVLASEFLEEYAQNGRQILFFTCHNWNGKTNTKHNMLG